MPLHVIIKKMFVLSEVLHSCLLMLQDEGLNVKGMLYYFTDCNGLLKSQLVMKKM